MPAAPLRGRRSLLAPLQLLLVGCILAGQLRSVGAAAVDECACAAPNPLPPVINVAILVNSNHSVGVLSAAQIAQVATDQSGYATLHNSIIQGLQLFTESMDAAGAMPLNNGGNLTWNYVWVNLGFVEWNQAATSFARIENKFRSLIDQVTNRTTSGELGGPFTFITAPLFAPEHEIGQQRTPVALSGGEMGGAMSGAGG